MSLRRKVIRLAYTKPHLQKVLLPILAEGSQKAARFEEGKKVDVAKWLRENGHEDAAEKWEKYEGTLGKTAKRK